MFVLGCVRAPRSFFVGRFLQCHQIAKPKKKEMQKTIRQIVNIVEKEGFLHLSAPLSTEQTEALEKRGYEVSTTKINLK